MEEDDEAVLYIAVVKVEVHLAGTSVLGGFFFVTILG